MVRSNPLVLKSTDAVIVASVSEVKVGILVE